MKMTFTHIFVSKLNVRTRQHNFSSARLCGWRSDKYSWPVFSACTPPGNCVDWCQTSLLHQKTESWEVALRESKFPICVKSGCMCWMRNWIPGPGLVQCDWIIWATPNIFHYTEYSLSCIYRAVHFLHCYTLSQSGTSWHLRHWVTGRHVTSRRAMMWTHDWFQIWRYGQKLDRGCFNAYKEPTAFSVSS